MNVHQAERRLTARAVAQITARATGILVGFLYEWNTGERQVAWLDKPQAARSVKVLETPSNLSIPSNTHEARRV